MLHLQPFPEHTLANELVAIQDSRFIHLLLHYKEM